MASPAPTPSTPDLIQASRPGFPKGLRVSQQDCARTLLGRGRATLARHRPEGWCSVLHVRERTERYRLFPARRAEPGRGPPADPSTFRFPPTPRPRTQVLFVMQDTATHAAAKRLLEDIGYEGTSARPIERWFFFRRATKPSGEDTCVGGRWGSRVHEARARTRGARASRDASSRPLRARRPRGTRRRAPDRRVRATRLAASRLAPPDPPALSGRTRMWEWHTIHLARMPSARSTRRRIFFSFRRSGFFSTKRKNAFGRRRAFWSR